MSEADRILSRIRRVSRRLWLLHSSSQCGIMSRPKHLCDDLTMIRTHTIPCSLPNAIADALNRASGVIYT
jgi:hypothetical protein